MGYVPHLGARRMARTRSNTRATSFDQVGLIYLASGDLSADTVCLGMMGGAEHELSKLHASLTFLRVRESGDWAKVDRLLRAGGVDGWLLYGIVHDEVVNRLKAGQLPCVILGDNRCRQSVPSANIDNFAVSQLALRHLAALGQRRIGYFAFGDLPHQQQIATGFRAARKELGLEGDEGLIVPPLLLEGVRDDLKGQAIVEWIRSSGATAVFAADPVWVSVLARSLRQAGIEVPQQVSLMGCETPSLAVAEQDFTRIELPMVEVGRQGALLLHRLATGTQKDSDEIKVAPTLVEGWSTIKRSSI